MESGLWRESVIWDGETYKHNFSQEVKKKQQDAHLSLMTMMIMGRSVLSFPAPRSSQDVPSSALCYF
jgi:hypothetical protein